MKTELKLQARNLFFQTELTKTQIANLLNISRRTLSYWVKEGNWNRLKTAVNHMPAVLTENCYHIFGHLTEYYLSERRLTNPVTYKEVDTLHKLTLTIKNLKSRSTINESMEMLGCLLDTVKQQDAPLAEKVSPYIEQYIAKRANIYAADLMPDNFSGIGGRIPWLPEDNSETVIDARENFFSDPETIEAYAKAGIPIPDEENISTLPPSPPPLTPSELADRDNAERLQLHREDTQAENKEIIPQPTKENKPKNKPQNYNRTNIPQLPQPYTITEQQVAAYNTLDLLHIIPPTQNTNHQKNKKQKTLPCLYIPLITMVKQVKSEQKMSNNIFLNIYNKLVYKELSKNRQKTKNPENSAQKLHAHPFTMTKHQSDYYNTCNKPHQQTT